MVKKTKDIQLCKKCGCPSKESEESLSPLLEDKAIKFRVIVCENFTIPDLCEKCSSRMLLRTLVTTQKNPNQGHIRMLFCTNSKCNNRKHLLKRTHLTCPRCSKEVVEMSGLGGLFVYACLSNKSAKTAHGIESAEEEVCKFLYRGDLLTDGSNHEPEKNCPDCQQSLKFKQTESDRGVEIEIVCSNDGCGYKHDRKASLRRALRLKR